MKTELKKRRPVKKASHITPRSLEQSPVMFTLTPTEARKNLSDILERAMTGENIGIVLHGQIVALRPVQVISTDYAFEEYGIAPLEMSDIAAKLHAKAGKEITTGKTRAYTGDIEGLVAD